MESWNRADAGPRRAAQLAGHVLSLIEGLRHGSPVDCASARLADLKVGDPGTLSIFFLIPDND
jgi:hypothetical protein